MVRLSTHRIPFRYINACRQGLLLNVNRTYMLPRQDACIWVLEWSVADTFVRHVPMIASCPEP
jgi:hypothetical protein